MTEGSAGFDLYADLQEPVGILPGMTYPIPTGIAMQIPEGWFGGIYARSGLATKYGMRPANCTGVVDSDYRGEIIVVLHNDSSEPYIVEPNERIAQMIIQPCPDYIIEEVDDLEETKRGTGGFGSTGQ